MDRELASKSVDWLMRSKREKLEIQFFGGEPTSEWDTLLHTLHYARHHPMRQGKRLEFVLTTNGLGLQENRLDKLKEMNDSEPLSGAYEEQLWRASRKYCKTKGVTQAEAREILINDPALCTEWANK